MAKIDAIYVRISSSKQDAASQFPDLKRWEKANQDDLEVRWFRDEFTGRTMKRPEWNELHELIQMRKVRNLVIWRLDRLGRTASGLTKLFDELQDSGVNLVSLKDGVDLSTPAGRMMANVLASVAQFETELRAERITAGLEAAKAKGKDRKWKKRGIKPGQRLKVTKRHIRRAHQMKAKGLSVVEIAKSLDLSRQTIYKILKEPNELQKE
ncbi:recombinase family protein [Crateriforma conspicua]|uniref:recombinase family protein n=1 Tax=Crateriforma conspicua TaxID=2527996 RepID=UPI00118AA03E|nr:recombinase family protein [Crateriforma conspicua]QDV63047.1 DNA-invertase hin [Crateriforma conspicua]